MKHDGMVKLRWMWRAMGCYGQMQTIIVIRVTYI